MAKTKNLVTHVMVDKIYGFDLITREEFLKIPISQRMKLIMELKVQFLGVNNIVIPRDMAIRSLTDRAA